MSISGIINTHFIVAYLISRHGTEEQKAHFLPSMAAGETRAALRPDRRGRSSSTASGNEISWKSGSLESMLMEIHQLHYFVAVAEEASFTRAAARVHVAQPGVSAQVRRLEAELGQQLLDRSGRSVTLTEAGAAVLPFARAALAALDGARLAVDELAGLVRGQVTVGMVSGCALPSLAGLLADFHRRYPGVTVALTEDGSDRLAEQLGDGTLDLALIGTAGPAAEGLETLVILEDELVAAVRPDDALAAGRSITVAQLRDQPLVSLPRGTGVRAALDAGCAEAGFTPRILLEASALPMVAQLAQRGLGVAVLPASAVPDGTLCALPVGEPKLRSRLELAWNPSAAHSPAATALIARARASVPEAAVSA